MSEPRTEAGKRLQTRLAYDRDPASYLPGDFYPEDRAAILAIEAEAALPVPALDPLRAAGDGYEVLTWVSHQPSSMVTLPGHPQLGGRYCQTDGADWPCAKVRAALRDEGETDHE